MTIYLHFIEPSKTIVAVSREASIGRDGFDVVVRTEAGQHVIGPDITVSARHAKIFLYMGKYYIEDLGSLNGTLINGKYIQGWKPRAQGCRSELNDGDVVELGLKTVFRVEFEKVAEQESLRRDHCSALRLLSGYLSNALIKSWALRWERHHEALNNLISILEHITAKSIFTNLVDRVAPGATRAILNHLTIMRATPQNYLASQQLVDELANMIDSLKRRTDMEYETCLELAR